MVESLTSAQLMPLLASYDYEALKDDISRRGVLVPVLVNKATGEIIDGHHRVQIAAELGIDYPIKPIDVADQDDAEVIAVGLNIKRRRMSLEQRQELAAALIGKGWTQQRIADAMGVDRSTTAAGQSGSRVTSPSPGPLRTRRAGFPAPGSSLDKAP